MNLLLSLAIVLFAAKLGGFLSKKMGQSAVLGEVLAGIIVGPSVLGLFAYNEFFQTFAELGIIFLVFIVGLELDIKVLEKFLKTGAFAAIFGAFIPYLAGIVLGSAILGWGAMQSFLLGVIFMVTSVTIIITVLDDLGKLKTKLGVTLIEAAIVDHIIGVVMLSFVVYLMQGGAVSGVSLLFFSLKLVAFFVAVLVIGPHVSHYIIELGEHLDVRMKEGHLSLIIILILALSLISNALGLSLITGAFLAGVILNKDKVKIIEHEISGMVNGFFIPFFFAMIGTYVAIDSLILDYPIILLIASVAILTKIAGAGLGARLSGITSRASFSIGVGMIPRCEIAFIVALLGWSMDILTSHQYSIIVTSVVITVLISPILLKKVTSAKVNN